MSKSAIAVKGPLIKTLIFASTTLLVLALVAQQLGQFRFSDQARFEAVFANASELFAGDPVLLNGVEVGKVDEVAVGDGNTALVGFEVDASVQLPKARGPWSDTGISLVTATSSLFPGASPGRR